MNQPLSVATVGSHSGASDAYHNVSHLHQLAKIDDGGEASIEAISRQFESLLVHQMLKSMRSANRVWSEGNFLSSGSVDFYQQMLDDQMSLELTSGDGLGFAGSVQRQLQGMTGVDTKQSTESSPGVDEASQPLRSLSIPAVRVSGLATASSAIREHQDAASPLSSAHRQQLSTIAPHLSEEQRKFIHQLLPLAERASEKLGVPPEQIVAQAALETGWGKSVMQHSNGNSSFNLFGIKADDRWSGNTVSKVTTEFLGGRAIKVQANFRSYDSLEHAFNDYVEFLTVNQRYTSVRDSRELFAQELQQAGYATDPDYASKIERISQQLGEQS